MIDRKSNVKDVVLGALLSLAFFGVINKAIDWSAETCPYDTDNTKFAIYVLILIVTMYLLYRK